ncbi:MAG TPA: sulfite oxidase [Actinomycetota bacterium]|nr:sulfite oxidase [Actinomycetota bacterium]
MAQTDTTTWQGVTQQELAQAARNHAMHLEALRYDVTPIGMHYLVIHFDIPPGDEHGWSVEIDGLVERPLTLSMDDLRSRPAVTRPVTMECAGNGRALMPPRAESQPWLDGAVGNAEWTGTPLAPLLEEAGLSADAAELVFTGADHGIQAEVEQDYQWAFSRDDILRDDVLLAYDLNGLPLPPQHGFPVRLLVPDWYGMCSVKWLTRVTAVAEPTELFQVGAYQLRQEPDGPGTRVTRKAVRSLMLPPGFSDFPARQRFVNAGPCELIGRAWSGWGHVVRVEVSADGGATWSDAMLGPEPESPSSWRSWSFDWNARPGTHELLVRATDEVGNVQPTDPPWNYGGFMNNTVQHVPVIVR